MSIAVIDYGTTNIRSILNAFESLNKKVNLLNNHRDIINSDAIVLPGVGTFFQGMQNLQKFDLISTIREFAKTGKPILGICLGMQMLFEESEEFGITKGLGLIDGKVIKLPIDNTVKLPHVGWNEIEQYKISWEKTVLDGIKNSSDMYFVHSYVVSPSNEKYILSITEYGGVKFCSSVKKENIYGCQFHPEKSADKGLNILKNFIKIVEENR